jgi:hypothetical protein
MSPMVVVQLNIEEPLLTHSVRFRNVNFAAKTPCRKPLLDNAPNPLLVMQRILRVIRTLSLNRWLRRNRSLDLVYAWDRSFLDDEARHTSKVNRCL